MSRFILVNNSGEKVARLRWKNQVILSDSSDPAVHHYLQTLNELRPQTYVASKTDSIEAFLNYVTWCTFNATSDLRVAREPDPVYFFMRMKSPTDNHGPVIAAVFVEAGKLVAYPPLPELARPLAALEQRKESALWNESSWEDLLNYHCNSCANAYANPRMGTTQNQRLLEEFEKIRNTGDPEEMLGTALGNLEALCIRGSLRAWEADLLFEYAQSCYRWLREKVLLPAVILPPYEAGAESERELLRSEGDVVPYRFKLLDGESVLELGMAHSIRCDGARIHFWIGEREKVAPLTPHQPLIETRKEPILSFTVQLNNGRCICFRRASRLEEEYDPYAEGLEWLKSEHCRAPWPGSEERFREVQAEPNFLPQGPYLSILSERLYHLKDYDRAIDAAIAFGEYLDLFEIESEELFQQLESWGQSFSLEHPRLAHRCLEAAYERFAVGTVSGPQWMCYARILAEVGQWTKGLMSLKRILGGEDVEDQQYGGWLKASVYLTMGTLLDNANDLEGALAAYRTCAEIAYANKDEDGDFDWENVGASLHNTGIAYERRGRLPEALDYFQQAYEVTEDPYTLERIEKLKVGKERE